MTRKQAQKTGEYMIGKMVQSTILTMISDCGRRRVYQPKQKVTQYSIIPMYDNDFALMLRVGGEDVFYHTCFNY